MSRDIQMYHYETDTPAVVRTSALNEELGQIEYIFSDKTGTLTCNMMDFMKMSVNGITYGSGVTEIARAAAKRENKILTDNRPVELLMDSTIECKFYDKKLNDGAWVNEPNQAQIREFLTLLGVCHTVITERDSENPLKTVYQASSPDEAALVKAAKHLGVEFLGRTNKELTISILGKEQETYQILDIIEFTSARKRMSVICRNPAGELILYCKGADSIIFPLLKKPNSLEDLTNQQLETFAKEGLRTLVCTRKRLSEEEYSAWAKEYADAKTSFLDRDVKIEQVADKIELGLELVGVTAIEDKLQDGVPDTIAQLAQAGIKIWVLTGDKQETAINIGFACDLLNNDMSLILVEGDTREQLYKSLQSNADVANQSKLTAEKASQVLAMIVDGNKLKIILADKELSRLFLSLGVVCKALV